MSRSTTLREEIFCDLLDRVEGSWHNEGMTTRRRQNHSYRTPARRSGRTLPAYLDGTKRTTPIKRTNPNYPTISTEKGTK